MNLVHFSFVTEAKQVVLLALHNSGLGGHFGITATYQKVKQFFSWKGLKKDVQDYVNSCITCQ